MSEKNTSQKQYIKKSRETLIGADSKRPQAQKGMGGPRGVITESSDNFGASWKNAGTRLRYISSAINGV